MSCANPNTPALKSLCACESAANMLAESLRTYQAEKLAHTTACNNYKNAWATYQTKHQNWKTNRQNKINELTNEQRIWNNCVLWTGVYGHDDWCQSDTGFGKQTGASQHGCAYGQGKGECKRTSDQINNDLGPWLSQNPEPSQPPGGTNGVCAPCSTCEPPSGINIQCCSQVFSDINSGNNLTIESIQNCQQEIKQQIAAATTTPPTTTPPTTTPPTTTPPTTPPPTTPPPTTTPTPTPTPTPTLFINYTLIGIILVFLILMIWMIVT